MSKIKKIREHPVIFEGRHEGVFRACHVLDYVKELLEQETSGSVILEIINTCYEVEMPSCLCRGYETDLKVGDFIQVAYWGTCYKILSIKDDYVGYGTHVMEAGNASIAQAKVMRKRYLDIYKEEE